MDDDGFFIKATPWFKWNYTPRALPFDTALEEFTILFETIIAEQVGDKKVILPLSGGLDSRTQAVALHHLNKKVYSYSYDFKGGYPETSIGNQIATVCDFDFEEFHIKPGYLWQDIDTLATINKGYSEFTHPRQMAILNEYEKMGEVFSLGHWGDVLFDGSGKGPLPENEVLGYLLKKILKKGGMELANRLWKDWNLAGTFEAYLEERVQQLLDRIDITNTSAKIRAFKSLYWAPRWTAVNLAVFESIHPITLPYFDDRMCQFICSLPEEYLADRKLQIAYIKKRNPKVAHIVWEQHKPFNLYSFHNNRTPYNIPYHIVQKLKREARTLFGCPYIQRNWELQFVGSENEKELHSYLFEGALRNLVPEETIRYFYRQFKEQNAVFYSHPVSMLLTLSLKMKQGTHG